MRFKADSRRAQGGRRAPPPQGLSAADVARLDTWTLELAAQVHGDGREEASGDWRFCADDHLVLHPGRYWHDFRASKGGHGALCLLAHLHGSAEAAANVARAWLAQHFGDGRLGRDAPSDDDEAKQSLVDAEQTAFIKALWPRAAPIADIPQVKAYFTGRNLDPVAASADAQLRWSPNWRGSEGALISAVTDNAGELVALQVLHLDPKGRKSRIQPVRRLYTGPHDWRTRGAFRIGAASAVDLVITEGVEDAIAARMAGAEHVHACLSVGGLGRAKLPAVVSRVVVARDDDPPGSAPCLALGRGVARLMLQGRAVSVTPRAGALKSGAKDIADLLKLHAALASQQLAEAGSVKERLDAAEKDALLDEISWAKTDAYENSRKTIATTLGWRARALDEDRSKRRQAGAKNADPVTSGFVIEPWPHPVTDVGAVLNDAVAELKRFLIVPEPTYLDTIALWSAHSHLLYREELGVGFTPKLAFQSPIKRCGKSTALKCTFLMAHKARMAASISPSSLFRAVDAAQVSIMIDEGDNVFKNGNPELLAIINSGSDRMAASVMRTEAVGDGQFVSRDFKCFTAIALTSIQQVPDTLQDRCVALPMRRALKDERPTRLTMRTRGPLIDIGRQLARWADDLKGLPDPNMLADLFNRVEDKWFVLFQIALLAGGDWPERCRKAAMADLKREEANDADGGAEGDLLGDVWRIYYEKGVVRLHTTELCASLINLSEAPWGTANRGGAITEYYLRKHLHDFLPEDVETIALRQWRDTHGQKVRGYHELHFQDAFERYLGKGLPSVEAKPTSQAQDTHPPGGSTHPGHPGHPRQDDETPAKSSSNAASDTSPASEAASEAAPAESPTSEFASDAASDERTPSEAENEALNQDVIGNTADAPDASDTLGPPPGGRFASRTNADGSSAKQKSGANRGRAKSNGSGIKSPDDRKAQRTYPRAGRGRGKAPKGIAP
jgi:putative DNA primase/helicase